MGDLRKIGKYILLEEQEQTGVGRTWRGAELAGGKIDKYLLIEFILDQLAADEGFLDQYLSQSLVAAKLEHPNILRKVNSIHEGGKLVAAFEFHEGFSLHKVLSRCQNDGFPLHIDHALLVTSKLLSALSYAKSKHLTHGFVHPTMVFVTHEGEIKLKGFAFSTALRHYASGPLPLGPEFMKYVPPGFNLTSDERDQMDIFACGAILYEMMMGEPFQNGEGTDVGERIDQAVTASSGEPVPPKIAAILHKSLNPKAGLVYNDILQMAKEMEELLYSGEYSPTTFNLAFFMHSAFRGEMEAFSERIAKEREIDFSGHAISEMSDDSAPPLPTPPETTSAPPPVDAPPISPGVKAAAPPARKKSSMPAILGGVAAVAIIGILVWMFLLKPKDSGELDRFEQRAAELQAEGAKSERALLEQQREELRLQNQMLMEQIKQQAQEKQKALEDDEEVDPEEEKARLEFEQQQEKAKQELEAERARLRQERLKIEAMRQQAATDQDAKDPESEAKAEEKEPKPTEEQAKAEEKPPVKVEEKTGETAQASNEAEAKEGESVAANNTRPVDVPKQAKADDQPSQLEQKPIEKPVVRKVPPVEGQLVALNDPDLNLPTLLVPYKTHQVPSKAIKAGVVRRDRTIPFIMKILVNEEGEVEDSELYRSPLKEGADDYGMIDKALRTARKLKFTNPSKMGVHVKVWMYITVNFSSK